MPFPKKILALFILCGLSLAVSAQKRLPGDKPRVIVQIVVGQMRADYLLRFKENLTEEGFRMFSDEGAFCHNARYQFMLTQTTPGLATISTGANPSQHGIPSDTWFDRVNNKIHKACHDGRHYPVGSNDDNLSKSPKDLVASTFGDELKLLSSKSKIFGVSFDPEPAILLSGHNSDGAYWFDALSGKFVTSSYYAESLPFWVVEFNNKNFANIYLENNWETLFPVNQYTLANGARAKSSGTPHVLAKGKKANGKRKADYGTLRETPYGDNIAKDFAISLIAEEGLGKDEATDLLSIYFGGLRDIGDKYGTMSLELEDAFYR
ncbi:MAG: alkaline phosphatase family protein, partial [Prevotellaceae bacterium]|nr:alkaline phosphatase family protein [Prevotellaceae bacterium]